MEEVKLLQTFETASQVLSAQVKAGIEARYIVAMKKQRDIDTVREILLKDCNRPYFAEVAIYRKPIGDKNFVEGPSIRFAESAIRAMGNIMVETPTIYEDSEKRIIRVTITDIESNSSYSLDITVQKTVERKKPKEGDAILSERINSRGEKVFVIPANEDALITKQSAMISKAIRTLGLRLIPGDIIDECVETIQKTLTAKDKQDPDAAKKKIFDTFQKIGVSVAEIKEYLGTNAEALTPKELKELRGICVAITNGETTWRETMEAINSKKKIPTIPKKKEEELPTQEELDRLAEAQTKVS